MSVYQQITTALILSAVGTSTVWAGSCCGGGSGANIILAKDVRYKLDAAASWEDYTGFWKQDGTWVADPEGSDLNQYRVSIGAGYRIASHWFATAAVPYTINRNQYEGGLTANSHGIGDTSLSLWYEAFDNAMCTFKVRELADLQPAIYWGMSMTLPTGISPYDDVNDNFKITGRGFYRTDFNVLIDKTVYPWTASLQLGYGIHFERPVNMEFGDYKEPYHKKLGNRKNASLSFGYVYFLESMAELTTTVNYSYLDEAAATVDGVAIANSDIQKSSAGINVSWTSGDKVWGVRTGWSHTLKRNNWGKNFPTTDVLSAGVSYAFK